LDNQKLTADYNSIDGSLSLVNYNSDGSISGGYKFYLGAWDGNARTYFLGGKINPYTNQPTEYNSFDIGFVSNNAICVTPTQSSSYSHACTLKTPQPSSNQILQELQGKNWNIFVFKEVKDPESDWTPYAWVYKGCVNIDNNANISGKIYDEDAHSFISAEGYINAVDGQLAIHSKDDINEWVLEIGNDGYKDYMLMWGNNIGGEGKDFIILYQTDSCPSF
jgi:hypothetical protein